MVLKITDPTLVLVALLTGVCLLLYGVRLVSEAVQQTIRERIKGALPWLSKHRLATFGIGTIATGLLQSSSAMASLLVEQVNADLFPLSMAIVLLLGSNVGSTLVVQLLVFHVTDFAFELAGLGALVALFTHRNKAYRQFGLAFFAFSLVILGLALIQAGSEPIANNPNTLIVLQSLANVPIALAVIGLVLAMVLNSSAAAIGLMLPLAATGALSLPSALALMLGANVGTTLLSMFASLSAKSLAGRRLALVHVSTKLLGAIILFLLLQPLTSTLELTPLNHATLVALTHLGFSLVLAVVFIPLSEAVAHLMELILPEKLDLNAELYVQRILDPQALATPAVAKGLATREALRMGDIVTNMLEQSMLAFEGKPDVIQEHIEAMDDSLDNLNRNIKKYLLQLDEDAMTDILLTVVDDLEVIGDVINQRIMSLARRKARRNVSFSVDGRRELLIYYQEVAGGLQQVLAALATHNSMLAREFLDRKLELKQLKQDLRLNHIRRLRTGQENCTRTSTIHLELDKHDPEEKAIRQETCMRASAIHLDLLHAMSTLLARVSNIAQALQELPMSGYLYSHELSMNEYMLPQEVAVDGYVVSSEDPKTSSLLHQEPRTSGLLREKPRRSSVGLKKCLISEESEVSEYPILSTGQFMVVKGQVQREGVRI